MLKQNHVCDLTDGILSGSIHFDNMDP